MQIFDWAVIGAGPAGIATVGKLLDHGIQPQQIVWLDPHFKVGDFGSKWRNVSSNTKVSLFNKFLLNCQSFAYEPQRRTFALDTLDPAKTCQLAFMAEPLQWITDQFKQQVVCQQGFVQKIAQSQRSWTITLSDKTLQAKNVVLATGADPKTLNHPDITVIALEQALDIQQLALACQPTDTVAVFGSSHSAIMAIRNLLDCSVKNVVNFYRAPLRYAVYFDDWILFDDTGLKGTTAEWARENIDGTLPAGLERYLASEAHIQQHLPRCNKAVYAVGFAPRKHPMIEGFSALAHNEHSGIIAPGLFGIGIAFPEASIDRFRNLEYRVGLWKFMDYLNRVMPVWLNYST